MEQKSLLKRMQVIMGDLPDSSCLVPLDIQTEEETCIDSLRRRKISYAAEANDRVPAWLFLPPAKIANGAAMLCLHQTNPWGKDEAAGISGNANYSYALELAQKGYVTLAPDYPYFGEYKDVDPYALGYASATMKGIWNHMRGLDLLADLPGVDAERMGCIGHSLGGHNTLFLSAFEPRVKVAVSSCGFTKCTWNVCEGRGERGNLTDWAGPGYMPRIKELCNCRVEKLDFDFDEILAAIAPRPLFVNAPKQDVFRVEGVYECLESVRVNYQEQGKEDHLQSTHPDCEHDFPDDVRVLAYDFIERHLIKYKS